MQSKNQRVSARSPDSFFNKKQIAMSAGVAIGGTISAYSTGIISTTGAVTISLPIIMGTMIGILPAALVSTHLSHVFDRLGLTPNFNALCQFTIRATTLILGILLGLAATSLLVSLTINPFTTPALIAGGVSAGLIVGLYVYAAMRINAFNEAKRSMSLPSNCRSAGASSLTAGAVKSLAVIGADNEEDLDDEYSGLKVTTSYRK